MLTLMLLLVLCGTAPIDSHSFDNILLVKLFFNIYTTVQLLGLKCWNKATFFFAIQIEYWKNVIEREFCVTSL